MHAQHELEQTLEQVECPDCGELAFLVVYATIKGTRHFTTRCCDYRVASFQVRR